MRAARALAAILVVVSALGACASPPPVRKDVAIGIVGEPKTVFDPDPGAQLIAAAVTESLVRRDGRDGFVARLAAEVPSLENGGLLLIPDAEGGRLVATFRLREGLTWQDGRPLTAGDVLFAWEQDRVAPPGSPFRYAASRIEQVTVISTRAVRVTFLAGERWDAWPLAPRVLPRHALAGATDAQRAAYAREPMHAGPFAVAAWVPGYGATLSAFPGYALGAPPLGRLEVRFFRDRGALLEALRRGEIDLGPAAAIEADLAPTLDRIADDSERTGLRTYYQPTEAIEMLRFATHGRRFGDARVRLAVQLAVDRERIVDQLFAGRPRIPGTYLAPPLWAASVAGPLPRPDRERAKGLLADAGFRKGAFGILEKDGQRMVVPLLVSAGSPGRTEAARLVAGDLAAVGIAIEVVERPVSEIEATLARGDFDLVLLLEDASDARIATDRWRNFTDPWFDVLATMARGGEAAEQRALYAELQRLWAIDVPGLPLYQRLTVDVAPRTLAGIQPAPSGEPLTWNAWEWRYQRP